MNENFPDCIIACLGLLLCPAPLSIIPIYRSSDKQLALHITSLSVSLLFLPSFVFLLQHRLECVRSSMPLGCDSESVIKRSFHSKRLGKGTQGQKHPIRRRDSSSRRCKHAKKPCHIQ